MGYKTPYKIFNQNVRLLSLELFFRINLTRPGDLRRIKTNPGSAPNSLLVRNNAKRDRFNVPSVVETITLPKLHADRNPQSPKH
jgi:hypothetical protein